MKPQQTEFAPYFHYYVDLVPQNNLHEALTAAHDQTQKMLSNISEEQGNFRYADGKWSIKELLVHLIDNERIFCNRALRFARQDTTDLPGYDHNAYVLASHADHRQLSDIAQEFKLVRAATTALFDSFRPEDLQQSGTANNLPTSVAALGFIIPGHEIHHGNVIREQYL